MFPAQSSTSISKCSASMFLDISLVYLLCLSRPVASATIRLPDTAGQSTGSPGEVQSASHSRRSSSGLSTYVTNSGCYTYLNKKDGCPYANPTNNCGRKMSSMAVQLFEMGPPAGNKSSSIDQSSVQNGKTLLKRSENKTTSAPTPKNTTRVLATSRSSNSSNSPSNSSVILGNIVPPISNIDESNICGTYNGDEQMGVCLWSGPSSDVQGSNVSGWVSSEITGNCHKEVILQRSGSTSPLIVARVLEGCSFNTAEASIGCSQIYVTKKLFMALNPNPDELEKGAVDDTLTWDFNSRGNIFNAAV